jgi:2-iminobutanoate/2-iminopropanoate deaminase
MKTRFRRTILLQYPLMLCAMTFLLLSVAFPQNDRTSKPVAERSKAPVEHIGQPMMDGQRLPFPDAVRVGDMYYLSAVAGETPDGKLREGFEAQARQAMDNVGDVLKRSGLGYRDLVKCTILFKNMDDWPAFNKIYAGYFPAGKYPARTSLGVLGLPVGALIEIECWAYSTKR